MVLGRRRMFCVPNRRAKLPIGYRRRKREVALELYEELDQTVLNLKKKIAEMAQKHSRSKPWIRAQLFGGSKRARFLRATPKTCLYDAYVHYKAKQMNDDLPMGDKFSLAEIKEKVSSERPNYKNRPAEQKAIWMAEYEADKAAAKREKRVNRKGEQLDASNALKRVSTELDTLYTRTGVQSLVIAVRSDILFAMNPFIFCDATIEKFLIVTFGRTPDQIARLLEMWAIHSPEGLASAAPKNAPELKKDVRMLIQNKLEDVITLRYPGQTVNVNMIYTSYEEEIVARHGIRLVGWTFAGGRMINPGSMTMHDLRGLYTALINQQVRWEVIPAGESGDGDGGGEPSTSAALRKRKERSDKGKPRGPNASRGKAAKTASGASAGTSSRAKKGHRKKKAADTSSSDSSESESD